MVTYQELKTMQIEMANKFSHNEKRRIIIGMGTCGLAAGAQKVWDTAAEELKKRNLDKKVELDHTGCIGFCAKEPLMEIRDKNKRYIYANVDSEKTKEIIKQHL